MSTHILDVSGARPLTSTLNDPAATRASMPAKQGDDVTVLVSGVKETRLVIPTGARIERRLYVKASVVYEDGKPKKDADGETVYEDQAYEELVLVASSLTVWGRSSAIEEGGAEQYPHTYVTAKRYGTDLHFTESGELLEELPVNAPRLFSTEALAILTADEEA